MREKELLKKSGLWTIFALFVISLFWFLFSTQPSFGGYGGGPAAGIDVGINSRSTSRTNLQPGTSGVFVIRLGVDNVTGIGTATGYMSGTDTYYPRIEWTPTLGTFNFVGTGSYPVTVQINGVNIPSAGSVADKINAVEGTGTGNIFTDTTLAGLGTITASFGANGLVISPAEYASVNNATGELQAQINGKQPTLINNTPGTITDILGYTPPANTQGSITTALGYTPLSNIAGSITTALGYTPLSNTAGSITTALGYTPTDLGNSIALGTETTGNTDNISEGSTNKYYTDARVITVIGNTPIHDLLDVGFISEGDFLKKVGGIIVGGSNTVTVAFTDVTGTATAAQLPYDTLYLSNYNQMMSSQSLIELERLKAGTITYKHYGNLIVDGFMDSTGITDISNGTYTSQSMALETTGYLINQPTSNGSDPLGQTGSGAKRVAQSFTLSATQAIKKVGVNFNTNVGSPVGSVTVRIVTNSGGLPSETLADNNLTLSGISITPSTWNDFAFATNGTLTSGVYWLRLYCDTQASGNYFQAFSDTTQPYANGTGAAQTNGTWATVANDMTFRIYDYGSTTGSFQSVSYNMPSVPTSLGCSLKFSTATTAITASLSRDGGTSFTDCPLTQIGTTTNAYYRSTNMINVSGQPSGQNVRIKINFGSGTGVAVKGFGLY